MLHIAFWILHTIIKGECHVYCLRLTFHLLFTLFLVVDASHLNASGHFCPTNGSFSLLFLKKQTKQNWWAFYLKQLLTKAVNASDQGDIILLNIRILKPLPFKTLINIRCFNVWLSHNIVTKNSPACRHRCKCSAWVTTILLLPLHHQACDISSPRCKCFCPFHRIWFYALKFYLTASSWLFETRPRKKGIVWRSGRLADNK